MHLAFNIDCLLSCQVCWTKYGSYPIHRPYCHEAAVRILLACLESHANRYKRYIVPMLSVHMDFYIRVTGWLRGGNCT
jgi:tRNA (guanine26-N2/guanine27-N2)-dimethyltransferase